MMPAVALIGGLAMAAGLGWLAVLELRARRSAAIRRRVMGERD